jgi:hypothetical protein
MRSHASRSLRYFLSVLLFVSPFLPASRLSSQQPTSDSSCPCTLRGVVLDAVTGNPIHNVFVQASAGSAWSTLTDSEGKFQLDALPAGRITVHAAKPGFLSQDELGASSPKSFSLQLSPDSAPAILKLTPEAVIFGQVTDENGEPLENFLVSLISRNPMNVPRSPASRQQATTDDEGRFRIASLRPGSYYVAVHPQQTPALTSARSAAVPQGFAPVFYPAAPDMDSAIPIKVLPGKSSQANFSLKREPFVRLTGTVSGYGPEQQVQLYLQDSIGEQTRQEIDFERATGAFHTKWIPPGVYNLIAQSLLQVHFDAPRSLQIAVDGIPSTSFASRLLNANSNLSGIHLVLQPTVNIPVVIRGLSSADPEQEQAPRVMLFLVPKGQSIRGRLHTSNWVDAHSGNSSAPYLLVPDVEPGTYDVKTEVFHGGNFYIESVSWGSTDLLHDPLVIDSSAAVPSIDVVVHEGAASLAGTVFSGDQPSPAVVVVIPPDDRRSPEFAFAGEDGEFSSLNLAPSTYRVVAIQNLSGLNLEKQGPLRELSSRAQEVTLVSGQTATLRLELTKGGE